MRRSLEAPGGSPAITDSGGQSPLRIGLVAPPWFAVPPPGYGGIERVVSYLADGLARRGHEVTLFASGGSKSDARIVSAFEDPPSTHLGDATFEIVHTATAYRSAESFDIIHDHTLAGLAAAVLSPVPVVHSMHGPITPGFSRLYTSISPPVHLVAISKHQHSTLPPNLCASVIHNGIDLEQVPFGEAGGDYLLFVGRMNPEKGVLDGIEIARRSGMPLLVVAKVNEEAEQRYFEEAVRPALRSVDADLLLQPPEEVKLRAYRNARATLFPARWPEPFGLVMIESMAAGTPVVAFGEGAVPEVVADGTTGFVCADIDQAVAAVNRIDTIDRAACRGHVDRHFSADVAVARHEALYRAILQSSVTNGSGGGPAHPRQPFAAA